MLDEHGLVVSKKDIPISDELENKNNDNWNPLSNTPMIVRTPNEDKIPDEIKKFEAICEYARENSVSSRIEENTGIANPEVDYSKENRHKLTAEQLSLIKKIAVTSVAAFLTTAMVTLGALVVFPKVKEASEINGEQKQILSVYSDLVNDASHRLVNDPEHYWVDTESIAKKLLNEEDRDLAMYGVYCVIGYNETSTNRLMNEVVGYMHDSDPSCATSFDSYLQQNGFVDNTGKPSTDAYESSMREELKQVAIENLKAKEEGIKK